jgi:hypothetical protein
VTGRLFLVCGTILVLSAELALGEGRYQTTRDGKTLVWNNYPKPGDVAAWSGDRDREGYARGFGRLVWYTKEPGVDKPELYARYWGRMVDGKLEGPVNVHSNRKTYYAIFIDGARATGWMAGTAPSRATGRWRALVVKRRPSVEREPELEAPAAGPADERSAARDQRSDDTDQSTALTESIQDLYSERWPKIDIDDSLRLLAYPPRSLRWR